MFIAAMLSPGMAHSDECANLWTQAQNAGMGFVLTGEVTAETDRCVFTGLLLAQSSDYGVDIAIESVVLSGDVNALLAAEIPSDLKVEFSGLRLVAKIPEPVMQYLLRVQSLATPGIAGRLSFTYDSRLAILSLTDALVDFGQLGWINLSGEFRGITLETLRRPESAIQVFGADSYQAEVVSTGLFESYLLMPLGSALLIGPDPIAEVDMLRDYANAFVANAPEDLLDVAAKEALSAVIAEMPNPSGHLTISGSAEPGFIIPIMAGFLGSPPMSAPELADMTVTYTPIPDDAP